MRKLSSLAILVAFVAALQGSASASTTYHLTLVNNSSAPVDFQVFQSDPGVKGFRASPAKQLCVEPKVTATSTIVEPTTVMVQSQQRTFELVLSFKHLTCAGHLIGTQRIPISNPNGTYTIRGADGHYTITP